MNLFKKCETCKQRRFRIAKRTITLPTGDVARSQKLICRKCQTSITKALNKQEQENANEQFRRSFEKGSK